MIDWDAYFSAMATMPLHPLVEASRPYLTGGLAIDLGCGAGQAAEFFAENGYRVLAVDLDPRAIDLTIARCADLPVQVDLADIREAEFQPCDLVHCGFVLFFLSTPEIEALFERVRTSIRPGGLFLGQFLGPNDTWVNPQPGSPIDSPLTPHTQGEIEDLLSGFELLHHEEVERDGATAWGERKHWHVTHVIARRLA